MNELKEVNDGKLIILMVSNKDYNVKVTEIAKKHLTGKKVCYVSLNKPFKFLTAKFETEKIDIKNFIFIDTLSRESKDEKSNVVYVSSPKALIELNISITNILENIKVDHLVFDSLSTLLIYEKPMTVVRFVHSLTAKLRSMKISAFFVVLKDDVSPELLKNLYMFSDQVIDLSKNESKELKQVK